MRVLVACEYSGVVREAFRALGFDAWSCDLEPSEQEGPHLQCDVRDVLGDGWDLMIAHPPCTYLSVSGARHHSAHRAEQMRDLAFAQGLFYAPIPHVAIENPVSVLASKLGPATQVVQPWYFGHDERKTTCLWLKNLPPLVPTRFATDVASPLHNLPPSKDRRKLRSRTFEGIAEAMATQWGEFIRAE